MNEADLIVEGYMLTEVPIGGLSFSKELIEPRFLSRATLAVVAKKRTRIAMLIEDDVYTTLGVVKGFSCRVGMTPMVKVYQKLLHLQSNYHPSIYHQYAMLLRTGRTRALEFSEIEARFAAFFDQTYDQEIRNTVRNTNIRSLYYTRHGVGASEPSRRPIRSSNLCQEIYIPGHDQYQGIYIPGYDQRPYWENQTKVSKKPPSSLRPTKFKHIEHRTITGISGINKVDMQINHVDYKTRYRDIYEGFDDVFRRVVNESPERTRNTFGRHSRGVFFQKLR